MSQAISVEFQIHFGRGGPGNKKEIRDGAPPAAPCPLIGRVPRIARLMALAIHYEELIQKNHVDDYAELARLGHVTRARVTQVMNLRLLAPDIQEALLELPRVTAGRDPVSLPQVQPITLMADWKAQRQQWRRLLQRRAAESSR